MAVRPGIVLTGLALAALAYAGTGMWQSWQRTALVGLSERPCSADGRSVTGLGLDDWAALCVWREENRRLIASGHRPEVVMIGDSYTERWPSGDRRLVNRAPVNRGVGGQTSAQVLLRLRQDALELRPRVVHILLGSNDLLGLNGPFTLPQFEGTVLDMIELAQVHGAAVILGTVPPMRDYDGYVRGDPAPAVARLNAVLRALAKRRGLVLADYHAALAGPGGTIRKELFEADGRHPNARGYAAMQRVLDAALARTR